MTVDDVSRDLGKRESTRSMLSGKRSGTARTVRRAASIVVPLVVILLLSGLYNLFATRTRTTEFYETWGAPLKWACVLIGLLLAIYAVRVIVRTLNYLLDDRLGRARGRSIAMVASIVLYVVVILSAVNAAGFDLSGLLLGGAFTGVVLGIAGQTSLSNIIAGLVILLARPYSVGMFLTARAATFGGVEYSGQVWDISLIYTTLKVAEREVRIPNSAMIAAVVVQRPRREEIIIPITVPHAVATDIPAWLDRLRRGVANAASDAKQPLVTIDVVNEIGYVVSLRAIVADAKERRAVETVVARLTAPGVLGQADPHAPPAQEKLKSHLKEWAPRYSPSALTRGDTPLTLTRGDTPPTLTRGDTSQGADARSNAMIAPVSAAPADESAPVTGPEARGLRSTAQSPSHHLAVKAQGTAPLAKSTPTPALRSVMRSSPRSRMAYAAALYQLCRGRLSPKARPSRVKRTSISAKLSSRYAALVAKWRALFTRRSK